MNKKTKKILSFVLIITLGLYAFFLLSPLVVTPILRRQEGIITELVKKSTGLENFKEVPGGRRRCVRRRSGQRA